ncbi:MAG: hypothetical protein ACI4KF_13210 [Huintestinicola sp.]
MKALKSHDLNFYSRFIEDPEKKVRSKRRLLLVLPFIIIAVIIAAIILFLYLQMININAQIKDHEAVINSADMIEKAAKGSSFESENALYMDESYAAEQFIRLKDSYPVTGSKEIETIFSCTEPGMYVMSVSVTSASIKLDLQTSNVLSIPKYVAALKATELFSSVDYRGYSGGDSDNGSHTYSFEVVLVRTAEAPDSDFDDFLIADRFSD